MRRLLFVLLIVLLLPGCHRKPEELRKALASKVPAERDKAAKELSELYAKDPMSIGDHGESYWAARLEQAKGKTTPEVVSILGGAKISGGEAGGGGESVTAHLDDFWVATLGRSTRGDDTVFNVGKPRRHVVFVDVETTPGFTGTWTTYYVNGAVYQKADLRRGTMIRFRELHETGQLRVEVTFENGKIDGTIITRTADGKVERATIWDKGVKLAEKAFHPNGQMESETTFKDGNLDRQRIFRDDGTMTTCQIFKNGIPEPCPN